MTQPTSPQDSARGRLIRIRNLRAAALNGRELAAVLPAGFNGRWTRRHWAHASLFAMLGTLVMALVPGFSNAMSSNATQTASIAPSTTLSLLLPPLPRAATQPVATGSNWQLVSVAKGETLSHVFERMQLGQADLQRVLAQPGARDTLRRLRPGRALESARRQFPVRAGPPGADHAGSRAAEFAAAGDRLRPGPR